MVIVLDLFCKLQWTVTFRQTKIIIIYLGYFLPNSQYSTTSINYFSCQGFAGGKKSTFVTLIKTSPLFAFHHHIRIQQKAPKLKIQKRLGGVRSEVCMVFAGESLKKYISES